MSAQDEERIRERLHTFMLLMVSGGFMGAYSYVMKGGVFANAETANCLLLAMSLATGDWHRAFILIFPISTYMVGSFVSEMFIIKVGRKHMLTWETILIFAEMVLIFIVGCIPASAPFVISHIMITFVSSMQYNTFRRSKGIIMSTVFCTAHLRQAGVMLAEGLVYKDKPKLRVCTYHLIMIFSFLVGVFISVLLCLRFQERAIWGAIIFLFIVFVDLLHDDIVHVKQQMQQEG